MSLSSPEMTPKCGKSVKINLKTKNSKIRHCLFCHILQRRGSTPTSISELLTARNSNYNLRGDAILKLPKINSTK